MPKLPIHQIKGLKVPMVVFTKIASLCLNAQESAKLRWKVMGYCSCCYFEADLAGGKKLCGMLDSSCCGQVLGCNLITVLVESGWPGESAVWVFAILVSFDIIQLGKSWKQLKQG